MNKSELETQTEKICEYTDPIHRDCFVNGYVTGALRREQKIKDLKADYETYYQSIYNAQKKLEEENTRLNICKFEMNKMLEERKDQLAEAKDLIKNILRVTWGEGWNYSLDWKVKAEQFLNDIKE